MNKGPREALHHRYHIDIKKMLQTNTSLHFVRTTCEEQTEKKRENYSLLGIDNDNCVPHCTPNQTSVAFTVHFSHSNHPTSSTNSHQHDCKY
jgi:hypothetical protein